MLQTMADRKEMLRGYFGNPDFVIIDVFLFAKPGDLGELRPVPVEMAEWRKPLSAKERLDLIYRCGQNGFHPVKMRCVTFGDIIPLDTEDGMEWHRVCAGGFEKVPEAERKQLLKVRSEARKDARKRCKRRCAF